jgi:cytidylate kinase
MPVITISRMYGSGGSEVAERVAETLGWSLFDNSMIDRVAERSGLTRAEVTAQDERVPSMVERLAAALSLGSPEIMPPMPAGPVETTEERVVAVTKRVIDEAVQTGPAVFVGRGAQCLLAER